MSKARKASTPPIDYEGRAGSFVKQLVDLPVGEAAARVELLEDDFTLAELQEGLPMRSERLRNALKSSVRLAAKKSGGKFSVEMTDTLLSSRRWAIFAVVTRTQ